ncbi:AMP-binding enzyme domain-containing protein [Babesia ovis]|uniref:AMP-binding enzyme domain-containing protein n=1 Tax=Babesia ovis TaxID=5869 RepID=A0A9W5TBC9_BABOV|nr:AMP-binding enzyme domain-containing protein [Babesia ovis]
MSAELFGIVDLAAFDAEALKPVKNMQYSRVLYQNPKKDESDVYCAVNNKNECVDVAPFPERFQTSFDLLRYMAELDPKRDHLGLREKHVDAKGEVKLGQFIWTPISYTVTTAIIIGSALVSETGLMVETALNDPLIPKAKFLGIWATNSPYWLMTDYAAIAYGLVTVPLYETMGDDAILKIFEETQMKTLCIDKAKLPTLLKLKDKLTEVKNLILFDQITEEDKTAIVGAGWSFYDLGELIKTYRQRTVDVPVGKRTDVATVIYTSGTSGIPKGAVHTNASLMETVRRLFTTANRLRQSTHFTILSYLPLSHVYERFVEHLTPTNRGRIGYYSGNIRNILDDIQTLKPDLLVGVPRVFTKVLDRIKTTIDGKSPTVRQLIKYMVGKKREMLLNEDGFPSHWLYDKFLGKIKKSFGGKINSMVLGSAAMAANDIVDLQTYLMAPISEGWGTTEVGICFLQDHRDKVKGTIGGPLGDVVFKLRSIPEMEYDARGNPPRGELLVKGSGFMLGYLRRPEETAEVLDAEGWYRTGDVVELMPSMGLRILDRARNLFKLSQGEYIAPEKLENLYAGSPYVEQIYIYGDAMRDNIVAIVTVNEDNVKAWAASHNMAGKPVKEIIKEKAFIDEVQASFNKITEQNKLNGLERLQKFTLVDELFSVDNGMLTPTFKTVRKKVRARYENEINAMYGQ